jgi:hypothetical protein
VNIMLERLRHGVLLLVAIPASCSASDTDPQNSAARATASTKAALDVNAFRVGCDVILGEGSGRTSPRAATPTGS